MPAAIPALPDLQRYTGWDQVPDTLATKTQLAQMDPPLKPGGEPVAQVLYHGNSYAPLFEKAAAVPRRKATPAQRAALDRARELQHICRRCDTREKEPLGRGRHCDPCRLAVRLWTEHDTAQRAARELIANPSALLVVVAAEADRDAPPASVAVVRLHDRHVLYAAPAGTAGSAERAAVLDQLDELTTGAAVVWESDRAPVNRYPTRLLAPADQPPHFNAPSEEFRRVHPWAAVATVYVASLWRAWYAWTSHPTSGHPDMPWDGTLPWSRSTAADDDGRGLVELLHRIADGTEPVWDQAAWVVDGHGAPSIDRA
ncbi:hypothetical protein [Streptomyces sp. MBT53]|uniref:hypothetical protein n=1 Tax=Streptomyces sp. MBT53 TaxID=1488384 RepID=UPI001912A0F3|nr:hypothetical protein [Streptomyces sp. MBT53]MBK6015819.1 hypothetical protein [Streptomyces sp. MBT53]